MKLPLFFALALVGCAPLLWAQGSVRWTMVESRAGKEPQSVSYQRTDAGPQGPTLVCRRETRTQATVLDRQGHTVAWTRTDASGAEVELSRDGADFVLRTATGTKRFPGESVPWVQEPALLDRFVVGDDREVKFAAFTDHIDARLQASDLTVFKATKVGKEVKSWLSGSGMTWKVRVTFNDFRSAFWGADYWFRVSDGQLVRYEEVRGGPGTPATVGILAVEER